MRKLGKTIDSELVINKEKVLRVYYGHSMQSYDTNKEKEELKIKKDVLSS